MGVFQSNVFQNNVFQGPHAGATASAAAATGLTGHWRGPARGGKKHRPGLEGRIRLLSELDPKPLFTPEDILDAPPAQLDAAELEVMIMDALGRGDAEIGRRLVEQERRRQIEAHLKLLADDDDNFLMM